MIIYTLLFLFSSSCVAPALLPSSSLPSWAMLARSCEPLLLLLLLRLQVQKRHSHRCAKLLRL
jgi:hypothetical protein